MIALVSCIQYDQVITLNKDGSGKVDLHYAMSEMMTQQMKAMSQMAEEMSKNMGGEATEEPEKDEMNIFNFEEDKIKGEFDSLKQDGISLTDSKTYKKDGWEHVELTFTFKDFTKLSKVSYFKDNDMKITKNAKGNYVIFSKSKKGEEKAEAAEEGEEAPSMEGMPDEDAMKDMMLPMMKGFRVSITFNTPTPIVSTTAPEKGKTMAKWEFDLEKDQEAMSKMEEEDMVIEFEGKGVSMKEMK